MSKRLKYTLILTIFTVFQLSSQSIYHKVKVDLIGKDILALAKLGLEVDHGQFAPGKFIINDYSESELALINEAGFNYDILIKDVSAYYSDPNRKVEPITQAKLNCGENAEVEYDFETPANYYYGSMGGYHTYSEMLKVLDSMHYLYPKLIGEIDTIKPFVTYDGNMIHFIRISNKPYETPTTKPQVLYTALHHAREPNSLSQMLFYMWYLLENYETDPLVQSILDNVELYFVPCLNPDGYLINEMTNPNGGGMWRKNAWQQDSTLFGVDLNRNYGYFWGFDNAGSSPLYNSATYRGAEAFSEPETQAMKAFCEANDFKLVFNYHTHGDLLIHPWGYSDTITNEHDLFRAMGTKMIEENNYTFGTGTETVGYVVNGDSDDWMYGEDVTKNPIYSFTPEVGPTFWPDSSQIDFLNKSCMKMNLNMALMPLNYYYIIEDESASQYLYDNDTLRFQIVKPGLKDGDVNIEISSLNSGVIINQTNFTKTLYAGESTELEIATHYLTGIENGDILQFKLKYDMGILSDSIIVERTAVKSGVFEYLVDNFDNLDNWDTDDLWALTSETFVSDSTSLVTSTQEPYPDQFDQFIYYKDTVQLAGYFDAWISFFAKWNIENDFDYVQLQVARVGEGFEPLCGKYTNLGSQYQDTGNPLYDGIQNEWVNEEINLKEYLADSLVFRLYFHSDQAVSARGFFMDDFSILGIQNSSSILSPLIAENVNIVPNPTNGAFRIDSKLDLKGGILQIYTLDGKLIKTIKGIDSNTLINVDDIFPGVYQLLISNLADNRILKEKLVIVNH
jgi:hypothetical protein